LSKEGSDPGENLFGPKGKRNYNLLPIKTPDRGAHHIPTAELHKWMWGRKNQQKKKPSYIGESRKKIVPFS